jgi:murein DD-endopeptidase MepM/ murein hydrolase activator NlpD
VTQRSGYTALAISIIIACLCVGLIVWRLQATRPMAQLPQTETKRETPEKRKPPTRTPTVIPLPGDPVLVRRGRVTAPPKDVLISVPARLDRDMPQTLAMAHFVRSTLVSATGGYMGKYQESGQEADALALQIAVNSQTPEQTPAQIEAGSDDDGGADTPADFESLILTSANSNQIEINPAGSQGLPQLKETVLRTPVAERISDLLIANGYAEDSARMIEGAAKQSSSRVDTLLPGSVALVAGALDLTGEYRVKQLAIFEDQEYVVTIGAKDDGGYDEAAEPLIPPGLLEESGGPELAATRFTVADGVYSAGLRSGAPEAVVREAIQLVSRLTDLKSSLEADEVLHLLYDSDFRDRAKSAGRVVYVGLRGGPLMVDCYAFEGSDGLFRCFDPNAVAAPLPPSKEGAPPSVGNSGATSVGGILAPIKGAPVTSLFGMRFHPILHIWRLHAGLDFGAPVGSPVRAAADGTVEFAGEARGFGNHVRIQHAGFETSYSHLSEIPNAIRPGVKVKEGDIIALSGNTGLSTGPHLHFEYYLDQDAVDPLPHLGSEIQSAAATLAHPTSVSAVSAPASGGPTPAEIESFHAIKAYLDAKLAELLKST